MRTLRGQIPTNCARLSLNIRNLNPKIDRKMRVDSSPLMVVYWYPMKVTTYSGNCSSPHTAHMLVTGALTPRDHCCARSSSGYLSTKTQTRSSPNAFTSSCPNLVRRYLGCYPSHYTPRCQMRLYTSTTSTWGRAHLLSNASSYSKTTSPLTCDLHHAMPPLVTQRQVRSPVGSAPSQPFISW